MSDARYKIGQIGLNGKRFYRYTYSKNRETYKEEWFPSEESYLRFKEARAKRSKEYRLRNLEKVKTLSIKYREIYKQDEKYKERQREKQKIRRSLNPNKYRQQRIDQENKWGRTFLIRGMLRHAKLRANKKGIPFNLDIDDIYIPDNCPILGIPIQFNRNQTEKNKGPKDDSVSLDRIIPELGYVKGNIKVISWRANRLKGDGTLEDFEKIVQYLSSHPKNEPIIEKI